MEMLRSLRGDKHEFCLTVIKFKHDFRYYLYVKVYVIDVIRGSYFVV